MLVTLCLIFPYLWIHKIHPIIGAILLLAVSTIISALSSSWEQLRIEWCQWGSGTEQMNIREVERLILISWWSEEWKYSGVSSIVNEKLEKEEEEWASFGMCLRHVATAFAIQVKGNTQHNNMPMKFKWKF